MDCTAGCYAESDRGANGDGRRAGARFRRTSFAAGFGFLVAVPTALAGEPEVAQPPVAPVETPAAPPEAPAPAEAPAPPPPPVRTGPSPEALATWEAQQLTRTEYPSPAGDWPGNRWGVHTGSGRSLTTAEFAAVTADPDGTLALRRHLSSARNERGWLYAIGGAIEVGALLEVAASRGKDSVGEDHLWRGLVLAGVGAIPIVVAPFRVRAEEDRARHVALNYSPAQADALVARYNEQLRSQLGVPAVILPPPPDTPADPADEP